MRDVSASGNVLYIEPKQLEATNTKLRQLEKKEAAIERAVRKRLSKLVGEPKTAQELEQLAAAVTADRDFGIRLDSQRIARSTGLSTLALFRERLSAMCSGLQGSKFINASISACGKGKQSQRASSVVNNLSTSIWISTDFDPCRLCVGLLHAIMACQHAIVAWHGCHAVIQSCHDGMASWQRWHVIML